MAVFAHVALVAPAAGARRLESGANFVILASDSPLPLDALRPRIGALAEPVSVLTGAELADFVGDASVLTDDYAPVDQLLTRP